MLTSDTAEFKKKEKSQFNDSVEISSAEIALVVSEVLKNFHDAVMQGNRFQNLLSAKIILHELKVCSKCNLLGGAVGLKVSPRRGYGSFLETCSQNKQARSFVDLYAQWQKLQRDTKTWNA